MVVHVLQSATDPCRVVAVEWDRSHDSFIAVVRAESSFGVIASQVDDLSLSGGLRWIRADEIVSMEDLPSDSPVVRLADYRRERSTRVDVSLTRLDSLFDSLATEASLVAVYLERTGSDECLVGSNPTVSGGRVTLDEIDTSGAVTGASLDFDLGEIIGVDWGTPYLLDLAELASLPGDGLISN